ncbi:MAG: hypothetical protein ACRDD8_00565 [Bacteroidales bacterium]
MNIVEFLSKANLKKGGVILNAPQDLAALFVKKGFSTTLPKEKSDVTILFLRNKDEMALWSNIVVPKLSYDSTFWVCLPKGSSGIKTDLTKESLSKLFVEKGYTSVKQMAVDDNWGALKLRPSDLVKPEQEEK